MTPQAALKMRVLEAARSRSSPTRAEAARQTVVYVVGSAIVGVSIFLGLGGFRPIPRPEWYRFGTAVGWAIVAVCATWGGVTRGTGVFGRSRAWLVALAAGTPLLLFLWMTAWNVTCPGPWPERLGLRCLSMTLALGVLPLVTLLDARRYANPVHPVATGAVLGAAAGAWAGILVDLWCPISYSSHVLLGHVAPLVLLTALGGLLGRRFVGIRRLG